MGRVYSSTVVALTKYQVCRILSMLGFCALMLALAIQCMFLLSAESRSRGVTSHF